MESISVKDILPENGKYVLAHYTGGNWHSSDDQSGCEWKVCKFVRGISEAERSGLQEFDARKNSYRGCDEWGNNLVPYYWNYMQGSLFGQDVDYWAPLPELDKRKPK